MQLQVHVLGAAAEHMQVIEEVVDAPFSDLRFEITGGDGHSRIALFPQGNQKVTDVRSAPDEGGVENMGVFSC